MNERRKLQVVEADEGDVLGNSASALVNGAHGAEGHDIVGGEDRSGARVGVEHGARQFIAAIESVLAVQDDRLLDRTGETAGAGGQVAVLAWPRDVHDRPMPQTEQVV